MRKCLLSVDWDYFINTRSENWGSYIENRRNQVNMWYKRYIQLREQGKDIQKLFQLSTDKDIFWDKIKGRFKLVDGLKVYVSESHTLSYYIAKKHECNSVYLFDAHSDLGYGGLSSLNFEVNCANWLGKLLKERQIKEANIIYSPYTAEKPNDFRSINNAYNVRYPNFNSLSTEIEVTAVHICRSGAWTPPWMDKKFIQFVNSLRIPYETIDFCKRKWDTSNISFSDKINYLMA